jgi:hypothetical protein
MEEVVDSSGVLARARREQSRFERGRVRLLPVSWQGRGGACDEVVGRFCAWFDGDENRLPEEPAGVAEDREALLAHLDSVQSLLPAEGWLTGQRVWYRGEAGRWDLALEVARTCGADPWWCHALLGLSFHGLGRYEDAERAFSAALAVMEPGMAERWTDTRWLLRGDARRALDEARRAEGDAALDRLWTLSDPLLLIPGNDRKTEHFARWTAATLLRTSRTPFGISWGRDSDELTVRMGWEVAWERVRDSGPGESVVGHHKPEGRDFLPRGPAVLHPSRAAPDALQPGRRSPRSIYTPASAPLVMPMDGQVAVFPRGGQVVVVATHYLPVDTVTDAARDSILARAALATASGLPERSGLFLIPDGGGRILAVEASGEGEGALLLQAPAGGWVVGVEHWAPSRYRAGRFRRGLRSDTVPPDVATLSDLLLAEPGAGDPATLREAARQALARPRVGRGRAVRVVWEVNGLGWREEEVAYKMSVEPAGRGLFRRLGQALGVLSPPRPLTLSWSEPGPSAPAPVLRSVTLEPGALPPGEYRIVLEARVAGREVIRSVARLGIQAGDVDD